MSEQLMHVYNTTARYKVLRAFILHQVHLQQMHVVIVHCISLDKI